MKKTAYLFGIICLFVSTAVLATERDGLWHGSGTVSFSQASGNTNSTLLVGNVDEARASSVDKLSLYGSAMYGTSQGVTNNDKLRGGARYDYNLSEKIFVFGLGELQRDSIAHLSLRTTLSAGSGYHMIQSDETALDLMGGLAYSRAKYLPATVQSKAELMLGEESSSKLSDTITLKQKLNLYPSLTSSGQYRSIFNASVVVALMGTVGLSVGVQHQYNSFVLPGVKRTDLILMTGLEFKL